MPKPQVVDRLFLLTHPGYGAIINDQIGPAEKEMFSRYETITKNMKNDEVMIALLCKEPRKIQSEAQKFVFEKITAMKEELMQRMLIITRNQLHVDKKQIGKDLLRARDVLENRGYAIDPTTMCIGIGETFSSCVTQASKLLREKYKLFLPPVIRAHYTNVGVRAGETPKEQKKRFQEIKDMFPNKGITIDWTVYEA